LPFYRYSLMATVLFSFILFGTYWMVRRRFLKSVPA
jgi:hypothetical protein